jgi:hypothetical protein
MSVATTETVDAKARRLLGDGAVMVAHCDDTHAQAFVHGDHAVYEVNWIHGAWACECPVYGPGCSHVAALRLCTTARFGSAG